MSYTRITPVLSGWPRIFLFSAIGLFFGVILSFLQPLEYSSTTRMLITQELGAVDAYTASRSTERIANDLANIVYTSTFFDKVTSQEAGIDAAYFGSTEARQRARWEEAIVTSVSRSTGLLTIKVYHTKVEQAELIVSTVASVLEREGWTYTSGGNIEIQVVDEPLNSNWPVRPNVLVNGFSGFVLGGMTGVSYILIQAERYRRRHQLIHGED